MVLAMAKRKRHAFFDNAIFLFAIVLIFWGIWAIDSFIENWSARDHGIRPGKQQGLLAIPFAPFLHASRDHLIGNTLPFLALGALTLLPWSRRCGGGFRSLVPPITLDDSYSNLAERNKLQLDACWHSCESHVGFT